MKRVIIRRPGILPLFLCAICAAQITARNGSTGPPINSEALPGMRISMAPWPPELTHLAERLKAIGFPQLPWGDMNLKLHTHQHLDVYILGNAVTVPANIGISSDPKFISPLHTHDARGIIHVESPVVRSFTLGQLFDVWGVRLNTHCIGGYCEQEDKRLWIFVNGKRLECDPRSIALLAHEEIVLAFGTRKELPNPVPDGYKFPPGF